MTRRWWKVAGLLAGVGISALAAAGDARAFCGFYVSGADARLSNDATQVVLMREGTRTVLSMQNDYQGPPQDFAMVVPVPVVLQKENVKTLNKDVFDHVDQLTAPRLVEYWEQDPCPRAMDAFGNGGRHALAGAGGYAAPSSAMRAAPVKVEAQFAVGEYDIVILSATDASALDAWLHSNGYKIPVGATPYLRPYVEMGMKFFVAKVDVSKVRFERVGGGPERAVLSPLRFHYDSDSFNLPIRLGLINSSGTQDLVVTILAPGQRYEVANYDNVAIPTNIDVSDGTRREFGAFYTTLFDQTVAKHPRAVVTEYAWMSNSCDPCPVPPLTPADEAALGADVMATKGGFVVTRLHARYAKDALGDDLFFRAAPPIVGGREFVQSGAKIEQGARPDAMNNFQARYVIRHPWTGPIACAHPQRGIWGGPPNGGAEATKAAAKIGFMPRAGSVTLASFVRGVVPPESMLSTGGPTPLLAIPAATGGIVDAGASDMWDATTVAHPSLDGGEMAANDAMPAAMPPTAPPSGGCAGCAMAGGDATSAGAIAALTAVAGARLRRRKK
jgi:MYXO-CTERM domain-containing protein